MRWLRRSTKTATGAAIATAAMALAAGSVLPEARASAASPTVTPATWGAPTVVRASVGVRGWTVAISASGRYLAYGDVRYDRWSGTATPLERGLGGARPNGLVGAVALAV